MNYHLDDQTSNLIMGINMARIEDPSKTILLVDESELTINDGYFVPQGHENHIRDLQLKHTGGGNVSFCSGHAGYIQKKTLLGIMDADSDYFLPCR